MLSWLRSTFVTVPLIVVSTTILGTVSLIVSPFASTGRTQHKIAQWWARTLLLAAGVRVKLEGLENIPPGGTFVFAANHLSFFDIAALLPFIPVQFRFLAKKSLFYWPFIGYHLKRSGHLPVDYDSARASLKSMAEAAQVIHDRGVSVLLFPEGGRTAGVMDPFKDGAAYIAIRAGVPVVPVGLIGTERVLPLHGRVIRPGGVTVRVGRPIPTLDLSLGDRGRLTQMVQSEVVALVGAPSRQAAA